MLSITHFVSEIKILSSEWKYQQAVSTGHVFWIEYYPPAPHYYLIHAVSWNRVNAMYLLPLNEAL